MKVRLVFLVAGITVSLASAEELVPDFYLKFDKCSAVLSAVDLPTDTQDPVRTTHGDPAWAECARRGKKVLCRYYTDTKKPTAYATADFNVLIDAPPLLMLTTDNRSERISIHTVNHQSGIISNLVIEDRPEVFGSKICHGFYLTASEVELMTAEKAKTAFPWEKYPRAKPGS